MFNLSDVDFDIKRGDRIAQLILERISMAPAIEVDDLDTTDRGAGGFGSTGVSASSSASGAVGAASDSPSSAEKKRGREGIKLLLFCVILLNIFLFVDIDA